jgi:cation diffusion facilitator CzcD-associated flavoprotein CzcO
MTEVSANGGNRVGIIGAGIAGLVTAKVLSEDGFEVVVLEKEPDFGGVWTESRTYPGLRTNNSRETYAFSDHRYSQTADAFPTAEQVREYLASYVDRFELEPLLRLSSEVVEVSRNGDGFELKLAGPGTAQALECDFVVVCAGVFSEPQVPEIEGAEGFSGALLHSSEAIDPAIFASRRVVVVGAGKSALDCAAYASTVASECTLVFRAPHWMTPRFFPGGIPSDRLVLTRLSEANFRYHRLNRFERFLHGRGRGLTRMTLRVACQLFARIMKVPAAMLPAEPWPAGIEVIGVGEEFYAAAARGHVSYRRDRIRSFTGGDELLLASGERIMADVVIFATGWRQPLSFLEPGLQSTVLRDGYLRLYRHILAAAEPRLGFVGYASSTACQLTAEVSAHWLSQAFRDELTLPDAARMEDDIDRVKAWLREVIPGRPEGYYVGPFLYHHIDDLLTDMGLPTRRTSNFVSEYLSPLWPWGYAGIAEERRRARNGSPAPPRRYLGAGHAAAAVTALQVLHSVRRRRRSHTN